MVFKQNFIIMLVAMRQTYFIFSIVALILELNGSRCKVSIKGYHYRYSRDFNLHLSTIETTTVNLLCNEYN